MVIWVVKFSMDRYKIRKVFGQKRGSDGDNFYLKFIIKFRKTKLYIFITSFYATF